MLQSGFESVSVADDAGAVRTLFDVDRLVRMTNAGVHFGGLGQLFGERWLCLK